jgi:hypothetical protein
MAYLDFPLSNFIGHSSEIIETLYAVPENFNLQERDDTEFVMNLKPIEGYNPTRDHTPSVLWGEEFEPIFGCNNVCIRDPYYILYLKLIDYITEKFEEDGFFKYCIDNDIVYELNHKDDVKEFLAHIIQTVPCSLYDIKENLGIN